jgi:membrane protease subunit (stomatin/prohibitin family)
MGIFKVVRKATSALTSTATSVAASAYEGILADQFLERIVPVKMDNSILACYGVVAEEGKRRNKSASGGDSVISNGSLIEVFDQQCMLLVESGKIIAVSNEPGLYQVDNSRAPSIFFSSKEDKTIDGYENTGNNTINRPGGIMNTLLDSFERFKFGGGTPYSQRVIYINLQESAQINFGTENPIAYEDVKTLNGVPLFTQVRGYGSYKIKIEDPILFYTTVLAKGEKQIYDTENFIVNYKGEFLDKFSSSLARLALENIRVTQITQNQSRLSEIMADILDPVWLKRGFYINVVNVDNISFDEETKKFLEQMRKDAILLDPERRAARLAAGLAAGIEAAGSNANGAATGAMGIGFMNNTAGMSGMYNAMSPQLQPVQQQVQQQAQPQPSQHDVQKQASGWLCTCGTHNSGAFCTECGAKKVSSNEWICSCGTSNKGQFCSNCGTKKTAIVSYKCNKCGFVPENPQTPPKFCPECGDAFDVTDRV